MIELAYRVTFESEDVGFVVTVSGKDVIDCLHNAVRKVDNLQSGANCKVSIGYEFVTKVERI